jgi:hypothetical protein
MATADTRSYIEQIKEMRALRMQQLKQVNADIRYQSAMLSYQRNIIRTNEKMVNSITSLGRTITGFVSSVAKTGGAAVGAAASGVSSVSNSIVSGLGKVLPLAIAGLLAKVMLWDNMSGDTKNRLSKGFGSLFNKLFSFVENTFDNITAGILRTVQQIKDAYKSLDIKFPIVNTVIKKFGALVDMIAAGFDIVKPFFDGIIDLVKADPAKVMKDTLKIMAGGVLLRYMIPVAASIVTTLLANRLLVNSMIKSMGAATGGSLLGSALTGAGTAAATAYGIDKYRNGRPGAITPAVKASARQAARTAAIEAAAARGFGARAAVLVPYVGWLLATGFTIYQVYEMFKEYGISEEEINQAVALSDGENLDMSKGLVAMGNRAPKPTEENLKKAEQFKELSKIGPQADPNAASPQEIQASLQRSAAEIEKLAIHAKIVEAYKDRQKQKEREEKGQDLEILKEFNRLWASLSPSERNFAIEQRYILIETADFYYYPDEKGKMVRISRDKYDQAMNEIISENMSDEDKGSFKTGLANLISKHEAGGSYDIPYGGSIKDGKIMPKYVPFPEGITGVSQMTGKQLLDYQSKQITATMGKVGAGPNKGTGAVGAFQFTRENVQEFYNRHPDLLDKPFSPEVQQMMFDEFSNGKIKELISKGDMKGLQEFVRKHWQIFSKSDTASRELAEYFKNPSAVSDSERKLSEEKRRKLAIDRYNEAYKRLMEPVGPEELELMTIKGESVTDKITEKVKDYYEERKQSIKDIMEKQRKANDPKELMSELLDTLNILGEVNQATNWDVPGLASAPVNNYNIVNNNTSTSMAGGSRSVYPEYSRNNYDHSSLAGVTRLG